MKISVTCADIVAGVKRDGCRCPIAQALIRQGLERVFVGRNNVHIGGKILGELPIEAKNFIVDFDARGAEDAKAFEFELVVRE